MEPILYCREKTLRPGSSFYYSLLKLPTKQQDGLVALFTLFQEIQSIPEKIQEESVARAKLQWWAEELQRLFASEPKHPATQALLPVFQEQRLPSALFEELLTSTELKLDVDHCCTEQDYNLYCYREVGIRTILAAYITGFSKQETIKFAHEMGIAVAHIRDIVYLRTAVQKRKVYFPLDHFAKFKLEANHLTPLALTDEIKQLLQFQANKAQQHYEQALSLLPQTDQSSQRHNLVLGKLKMKQLDEVSKDGFQVFTHHTHITPLRKLWIAWRG